MASRVQKPCQGRTSFLNTRLTALFIVLCKGRTVPRVLRVLVTGVIANTLTTAVVDAATFAQPEIGRAYLSGYTAEAVAINNDVYGTALNATALPVLLLLTSGLVL